MSADFGISVLFWSMSIGIDCLAGLILCRYRYNTCFYCTIPCVFLVSVDNFGSFLDIFQPLEGGRALSRCAVVLS